MKLHASVGAEILSSIDFPYPVVPIVRHHHENWDGTGYPDRLAGTDIPIGARILSVVDCFDALTSDRPYRPRLRDAEAVKMLSLRRGTMYDPLVVDSFLRVHSEMNIGAEEDALDEGAGERAVEESGRCARTRDVTAGSPDEKWSSRWTLPPNLARGSFRWRRRRSPYRWRCCSLMTPRRTRSSWRMHPGMAPTASPRSNSESDTAFLVG